MRCEVYHAKIKFKIVKLDTGIVIASNSSAFFVIFTLYALFLDIDCILALYN